MSDEQAEAPPYVPFIELPKARFAHKENVFFWVGVRAKDPEVDRFLNPIREPFWGTCRLTITRPDGSVKVVPVPWVRDGWPYGGWQGGQGLGEAAVPGEYALVFEFAGRKSALATFVVEKQDPLESVFAGFVFKKTRTANSAFATLSVHNRSGHTLRFPERGANGPVWVHLNGVDGPTVHTFYPWNKLPNVGIAEGNISFNTFSWNLALEAVTITLKPGQSYRLSLSLRDVIENEQQQGGVPPGLYDVTFGTSLQILIGEKDGAFAQISPVRLSVEGSARCVVGS